MEGKEELIKEREEGKGKAVYDLGLSEGLGKRARGTSLGSRIKGLGKRAR